jgi:hypothetical protein
MRGSSLASASSDESHVEEAESEAREALGQQQRAFVFAASEGSVELRGEARNDLPPQGEITRFALSNRVRHDGEIGDARCGAARGCAAPNELHALGAHLPASLLGEKQPGMIERVHLGRLDGERRVLEIARDAIENRDRAPVSAHAFGRALPLVRDVEVETHRLAQDQRDQEQHAQHLDEREGAAELRDASFGHCVSASSGSGGCSGSGGGWRSSSSGAALSQSRP